MQQKYGISNDRRVNEAPYRSGIRKASIDGTEYRVRRSGKERDTHDLWPKFASEAVTRIQAGN